MKTWSGFSLDSRSLAQGAAAWLLITVASCTNSIIDGRAGYSEYYCPDTDASFTVTSDDRMLTIIGPPLSPRFSDGKLLSAYYKRPLRHKEIELEDCSTKDLLCRRVVASDASSHQYVFLPRQLGFKRFPDVIPFHLNEYSGLSLYPGLSMGRNNAVDRIRVILWQGLPGKSQSITLVVERDRGVVYFNGPELWAGKEGELRNTCVLQSRFGMFRSVQFLPPPASNAIEPLL